MKKIKLLLCALVVLSFSACIPEDETECDYSSLYPEISDVQFTIDGKQYTQNVSSKSFPNSANNYEKIYVINSASGSTANIDLYFTYIDLLGNAPECAAEYEHRIAINLNVDQGVNETKTYPVSLVSAAATGSYVFEKEMNKFPSSNSSITITNYIPENILKGTFNITFGDTPTSGSFDLDLSKNY